MWKYPWKYSEGIAICIGLFITGALLQSFIGEINLDLFRYPINLVFAIIYIVVLVLLVLWGKKNKYIRWFSHYEAAFTSLATLLILVVIMGITKQRAASNVIIDDLSHFNWSLGFDRMTVSWIFELEFIYFLSILGMVTIRRLLSFKKRDITFILNHLGLFIALFAGIFGSSDLQKIRMQTKLLTPEWRGVNESGNLIALPIAIELKNFTIDEYPPKLFIISNHSGKIFPKENPQSLLIEKTPTSGKLLDWNIHVTQYLPNAASVFMKDSTKFVPFRSIGSTSAVYVVATKNNELKEGWVSCGNYMFPHHILELDSLFSVVMPEREPKQFASTVNIYVKDGKTVTTTIEVNKPYSIEGWKIYQLSYDENMGRWSTISVFELVKDPWLPYVYLGIILMLIGALGLFFRAKKTKDDDDVE